MALDSALQELVDKTAIRDLMARYARGIERRDSDLIASTSAADAYANHGGWNSEARDNIVSITNAGDQMKPADAPVVGHTLHLWTDEVPLLWGLNGAGSVAAGDPCGVAVRRKC